MRAAEAGQPHHPVPGPGRRRRSPTAPSSCRPNPLKIKTIIEQRLFSPTGKLFCLPVGPGFVGAGPAREREQSSRQDPSRETLTGAITPSLASCRPAKPAFRSQGKLPQGHLAHLPCHHRAGLGTDMHPSFIARFCLIALGLTFCMPSYADPTVGVLRRRRCRGAAPVQPVRALAITMAAGACGGAVFLRPGAGVLGPERGAGRGEDIAGDSNGSEVRASSARWCASTGPAGARSCWWACSLPI